MSRPRVIVLNVLMSESVNDHGYRSWTIVNSSRRHGIVDSSSKGCRWMLHFATGLLCSSQQRFIRFSISAWHKMYVRIWIGAYSSTGRRYVFECDDLSPFPAPWIPLSSSQLEPGIVTRGFTVDLLYLLVNEHLDCGREPVSLCNENSKRHLFNRGE